MRTSVAVISAPASADASPNHQMALIPASPISSPGSASTLVPMALLMLVMTATVRFCTVTSRLPGAQGACQQAAEPVAKRGEGGHEAEDAGLADARAVGAAEDAHGRRHEHAGREPLHGSRHEEDPLEPRADGRGRDGVPQRLPEERTDHERFGGRQVRQRAGDDDGEAAGQHR